MHRVALVGCLVTLAVGCGTCDPQPAADGSHKSEPNVSPLATVRIHINGFQKSKSGAT